MPYLRNPRCDVMITVLQLVQKTKYKIQNMNYKIQNKKSINQALFENAKEDCDTNSSSV